jgi:hypothetical protein
MSLRPDTIGRKTTERDPLMTEPKTDSIAAPGAVLRYDVRSSDSTAHPVLLISAAPPRVVIGAGEESRQLLAGRAGVAVAGRLGTEPVTFPGGHDGFLGGEFGRTGKPDAFAVTLRDVLDAT